jgi:hypothetical protein
VVTAILNEFPCRILEDKEHRIGELGRQVGKELTDKDPLNIFEIKMTYDWRIERLKGGGETLPV